jgi:D-alanyl-D-alanine carboxypeptidase
MLLQHTSGLFDYTQDSRTWAPYQGDPTYVWPPDGLLAIAADHPPLFPPGTDWAYSNTNYVLLGRLVETVTGHTLRTELTTRVLAPLALADTYFPQTSTVLRGRYAHGYTADGGGGLLDVTGWSTSWAWAAGSLVSTPADVSRFYRALLAGQIVPPRLLDQMLHTVPTPAGFGYGLGLLTTALPCADAIGHDGSVAGYWTTALTSPDRSRQVTITITEDEPSITPAQLQAVAAALVTGFCPESPAAAVPGPVLPVSAAARHAAGVGAVCPIGQQPSARAARLACSSADRTP